MANGAGLEDIAKAICVQRTYAFLGRIGAGAFKESFRVKAPSGEEFALKVLKPGCNPERLDREIQAMQRCSHGNIGRLIEINTWTNAQGKFVYLLEGFLAGGTLAQRIKAGAMAPAEVKALGAQLADAIAYLESLDLVHRDLKPDNILFGADPQKPIVVDFGLVRDLAETSLTQTWLIRGPGIPLFAPPEQLNNHKQLIDWRSDQFSLGVTLSYCAFGFHPYSEAGDTDLVIVDRVAQHQGPSARFAAAARAAGLDALITMAMPYPVQRFCVSAKLVAAWR